MLRISSKSDVELYLMAWYTANVVVRDESVLTEVVIMYYSYIMGIGDRITRWKTIQYIYHI